MERLDEIARCVRYLNAARDGIIAAPAAGFDKLNWLMGQMDWYAELHRLLYETN